MPTHTTILYIIVSIFQETFLFYIIFVGYYSPSTACESVPSLDELSPESDESLLLPLLDESEPSESELELPESELPLESLSDFSELPLELSSELPESLPVELSEPLSEPTSSLPFESPLFVSDLLFLFTLSVWLSLLFLF